MLVILLIVTAGMMAGLTMGLMSLDKLNLTILHMEGTALEQERAKRLLTVIKDRHLLLVTLLLVNAGANEALPVFLNRLVSETTAILISVTCVLFFGEIIPSAFFSGPNQVYIASLFVPFVKILICITYPISYPISKILDCVLGKDHDTTHYKRNELKALVILQRENIAIKENLIRQSERLHVDEVTIIHGALDLTTKTASSIMISWDSVFMLNENARLDHDVMARIMASGHSRIPVYRGNQKNILGVLIVKKLIVLDPDDERPISDLHLRKPIVVDPDYSCYALLNEFQKGKSHLAILTRQASYVRQCWAANKDIDPSLVEFKGIVTLEDVVEELIQEEIEDETDVTISDVLENWTLDSRRKKLQEAGVRLAYQKFRHLLVTVRRRKAGLGRKSSGEKQALLSKIQIDE